MHNREIKEIGKELTDFQWEVVRAVQNWEKLQRQEIGKEGDLIKISREIIDTLEIHLKSGWDKLKTVGGILGISKTDLEEGLEIYGRELGIIMDPTLFGRGVMELIYQHVSIYYNRNLREKLVPLEKYSIFIYNQKTYQISTNPQINNVNIVLAEVVKLQILLQFSLVDKDSSSKYKAYRALVIVYTSLMLMLQISKEDLEW